MDNKDRYFLRIAEGNFGFLVEGIHSIRYGEDIPITTEDYNRFFELQSQGKQFRLVKGPLGNGLFDHLEEYIPKAEPQEPQEPTEMELLQEQVLQQSEYLVEMDFRLVNMELGL